MDEIEAEFSDALFLWEFKPPALLLLSVSLRTSFLESFSPRLCQHMKLARWKKGKGVVREKWKKGGGAVVKLASDHLLSGILCRGQSAGAAMWRCDWLRKGEMKTTVNFWPRRRSSAGTPSPSSGVVEQSPLSSCVYSTNPTGMVGRGGKGEWAQRGRGERHKSEREGGREERKSSGLCSGLKMRNSLFAERHSQNVHTNTLLLING